jgi:hypothetical protein
MRKLRYIGILPILLLAGCSSKPNPPASATQTAPGQTGQTLAVQPGQVIPLAPAATSAPPASAAAPAPASTPAPPAPPPITLPQGTVIRVRLAESLDTRSNHVGERFTATLDSPIVVNNSVVVPKGATFTGRIDASKPSGRLKGRAVLDLRLVSFELKGVQYRITTSDVDNVSGRHRRRNIVAIGGGAGAGAGIGALAGGPAGALIGAGAGAGAGTIGAVFTGKKNVHLPVETVLRFFLREPVPL